MTTELMVYQKKVASVRDLLERSRTQIALALPKHMNADRLLRVAMTSVQRNPKLLDCSQVSLIAAIIQSAQLGLEPDDLLGHAYLVPFKTTVVLIPGYKGLISLARRSGEIKAVYARVVYEKDHFKISFGINETLEHIPTAEENPGPIIGCYAVAHFKDGGYQVEWMWKREIDAIRKRSKAANEGPWVTDYEMMAKKTVLRRLCKLLPASVELATAVALDERAEEGLPQDLETIIDLSQEEGAEKNPDKGKKKLDMLTEQLDKEKPPRTENIPLACSSCLRPLGQIFHRHKQDSGDELYLCPECYRNRTEMSEEKGEKTNV